MAEDLASHQCCNCRMAPSCFRQALGKPRGHGWLLCVPWAMPVLRMVLSSPDIEVRIHGPERRSRRLAVPLGPAQFLHLSPFGLCSHVYSRTHLWYAHGHMHKILLYVISDLFSLNFKMCFMMHFSHKGNRCCSTILLLMWSNSWH